MTLPCGDYVCVKKAPHGDGVRAISECPVLGAVQRSANGVNGRKADVSGQMRLCLP